MKNIFFTIAIFAILLSSCSNNSSKKPDTHIHDDGTEHVNHNNCAEKTPKQEIVKVAIDSLSIETDSLNNEHETVHSHDEGHLHNH